MVFLAVLKLKGVTKNMANNRCLSLLSLKISLKWEQGNVVSKYMGQSKWVEETIASKRYQQSFKRWKANEVVTIAEKTEH